MIHIYLPTTYSTDDERPSIPPFGHFIHSTQSGGKTPRDGRFDEGGGVVRAMDLRFSMALDSWTLGVADYPPIAADSPRRFFQCFKFGSRLFRVPLVPWTIGGPLYLFQGHATSKLQDDIAIVQEEEGQVASIPRCICYLRGTTLRPCFLTRFGQVSIQGARITKLPNDTTRAHSTQTGVTIHGPISYFVRPTRISLIGLELGAYSACHLFR